MANASLQIGNGNWAIKEDNLLGYSKSGTRFLPIPITMTRSTLGTRVNPSGLIEDVALLGSELVTNGSFTTDSDWYETGTWSIESNYATASGNGTSQYIQQDFTITNGKTYLFTYEIIENTLNGVGSALSGSGGFVQIFLSNVIGTHQVYITADDDAAAYALKIGVSATATTGTIKLDNVSVKEATIDGLARVDYTDGTSSLLVEPQRTNLITYSEDFTQSAWTKTNVDVSNNTELAPSGTLTATRTIISSTGTDLRTQCNVIASSNYTFSFYAKKGTSTDITYRVYDVSNGSNIVSPTNYYSQLSTDWERVSLNFTTPSGCTSVFVYLTSDSVEIGDIYLWGAQLELGSYPTSYIKTQGSTVTRNQDEYEKTGINNLIGQTEGTLFVEYTNVNFNGTSYLQSLDNGTSSERIELFVYNGNISISVRDNNVQQVNVISNVSASGNNKIAFAYKLNDFAFYINGNQISLDSNGTIPSITKYNLYGRYDGATGDMSNLLKSSSLYNTRLSNIELATLTTI